MECPICYNEKQLLIFRGCTHQFCDDCIRKIKICAICRCKKLPKPTEEFNEIEMYDLLVTKPYRTISSVPFHMTGRICKVFGWR